MGWVSGGTVPVTISASTLEQLCEDVATQVNTKLLTAEKKANWKIGTNKAGKKVYYYDAMGKRIKMINGKLYVENTNEEIEIVDETNTDAISIKAELDTLFESAVESGKRAAVQDTLEELENQ